MTADMEVIELDYDELESKLDEIEQALGPETAQPFRELMHSYGVLLELLREKTISIQRLQHILFGSSSEQSSKILPASEPASKATGEDSAELVSDQAAGDSGNSDPATTSGAEPKRRRPGHGRMAASAYTGCLTRMVPHGSLHADEPCPRCGKGTLYRLSRWSPVVRLKGQPPVGGTVYQLERLRCNLCGAVETAALPEEAGPQKYDVTVPSIIATLRYGEGMPWNRFQRVQGFAGIPLPASTQWKLVRDAVARGPQAAYDHLLWLAAQGELVHNDDTEMRVLELMKLIKNQQPILEDDPKRRGVYTTGILSLAQGRPTIALFFTGPQHSGENLRSLLAKRQDDLPPPIQMCDGLSRNMPEDLKVILANCLTHGRRNFVDVVAAFPSQVRYVIECLKQVYKTDDEARKQQLSPEERLRLHQQKSGPVMQELHDWLKRQFEDKQVEPNSSLGKAIAYTLKHWEKLTLFLRVPGAPLDNNVCEQALKMAIRHRKNSLFYKTLRGAKVGDLYMSLIHTCYFCGADPFDYLTQLQRHHDRVHAAPGDWMPWNYRQQLADSGVESNGGSPPATEAFSVPIPDS